MLTLGTGVGGGVIIDGNIFRGATGLGAELGHMVIQADGLPCPGRTCNNRGCVEAYCSGKALELAAGMPREGGGASRGQRSRRGPGAPRRPRALARGRHLELADL